MKARIFCQMALLGLALGTATVAQAVSDRSASQTLFERSRPSVVEVQVKFKGNQGVASGGSGFLVHRNDLVVTNYHVVTETIYEPAEHELIVVTDKDQHIGARVVSVDVLNDLAVLKLDQALNAAPLTLQEATPARGEQGYSMGKPGAYSQSIVGGTFNGIKDQGSTPQIIFSGPINSGMSGGPTINAQGEVVGVNVASSTRNQLIGLVVPAQAAGVLIRGLGTAQIPDNATLRQTIAAQFGQYGRQQLRRLSQVETPIRTLGPFSVQGDLSEANECRTFKREVYKSRVKTVEQNCRSNDGLYVDSGLYAGFVASSSFWLQGLDISALNLSRQVESKIDSLRSVRSEEESLGIWSCDQQRLRAHADVPIQIYACSRPVEKLPGLFDFRFRYAPLITGKDALVVSMSLRGFDPETALLVLKQSISTVRTPQGASK